MTRPAVMGRRAGSIVSEIVAAVVREDTPRASDLILENLRPDVVLVLAHLVATGVHQAVAVAGVSTEDGLAALRDMLVVDLPAAVMRHESPEEDR